MFNVMVANCQKKGRYCRENIENCLRAQVENSLNMSWNPDKIMIVTNFPFKFLGVTGHEVILNKTCLTGSKMWALQYIFQLIDKDCPSIHEISEVYWAHDLDAWQNSPFAAPDIKDVGITTYSNDKYNGGSSFWKPLALDIVNKVVSILEGGQNKEEPTLNRVLKSDEYKERVTLINTTYNVGCSGFVPRLLRAEKPVKVAHINPHNRIAWETHSLDRNGIGVRSISDDLEKTLRKYFPHLAVGLALEGKMRQQVLREKNQKHLKKEKWAAPETAIEINKEKE